MKRSQKIKWTSALEEQKEILDEINNLKTKITAYEESKNSGLQSPIISDALIFCDREKNIKDEINRSEAIIDRFDSYLMEKKKQFDYEVMTPHERRLKDARDKTIKGDAFKRQTTKFFKEMRVAGKKQRPKARITKNASEPIYVSSDDESVHSNF